MSIELTALQQQRRDTASNWTGANPTLLNGELGYETDTGKFKIGDGSTAWSSLGYLPIPDSNGLIPIDQLLLAAGTAAAPSLTFTGDVDTGIYSPSANTVAVSTAGTGRLLIDSNGNVGIGVSSVTNITNRSQLVIGGTNGGLIDLSHGSTAAEGRIYVNDGELVLVANQSDGEIKFQTGGANERFRIDSSGRLLAGTSSARTDLIGGTRGGRVQIEEASSTVATAVDNSSLCLTMGSSGSTGSANIFFTRTKSDSLGGVTSVSNNNVLGGLYFQGTDGTDAVSAALIKAEVDGVPGANDMPGRLVFSTTADGSSSPTEHFRIANNGDLTATDTTIGSNSDSRLKTNVADFIYDLEDFKQYQPKTFDWKNPELHGNKTGQRGFIAQDVEAIDSYWVAEQAVSEDSADAEFLDADRLAKTLKLGKKDAMYVSVIQQLLAKVETLEAKVAALEAG